jgi:hypothetical protein
VRRRTPAEISAAEYVIALLRVSKPDLLARVNEAALRHAVEGANNCRSKKKKRGAMDAEESEFSAADFATRLHLVNLLSGVLLQGEDMASIEALSGHGVSGRSTALGIVATTHLRSAAPCEDPLDGGAAGGPAAPQARAGAAGGAVAMEAFMGAQSGSLFVPRLRERAAPGSLLCDYEEWRPHYDTIMEMRATLMRAVRRPVIAPYAAVLLAALSVYQPHAMAEDIRLRAAADATHAECEAESPVTKAAAAALADASAGAGEAAPVPSSGVAPVAGAVGGEARAPAAPRAAKVAAAAVDADATAGAGPALGPAGRQRRKRPDGNPMNPFAARGNGSEQ